MVVFENKPLIQKDFKKPCQAFQKATYGQQK